MCLCTFIHLFIRSRAYRVRLLQAKQASNAKAERRVSNLASGPNLPFLLPSQSQSPCGLCDAAGCLQQAQRRVDVACHVFDSQGMQLTIQALLNW
jgi:hypothetical protein